MKRLIEIRSYTLKPGSGGEFHQLVRDLSMPLVRAWGTEVVAYGPSQHDADGYFLIRAFDSLEHLRASEHGFYASDAWRKGPREAIVALIVTYTDAVLWLSAEALAALRDSCALNPGLVSPPAAV